MIDGGALQYTGGTASYGRAFTLGASGGTLDASGTGTLTLGNSGSLIALSGAGANRTLTLTGNNTGNNTLNLKIEDGTGANTYTVGTTINGGNLVLGNASALGTITSGGGSLTLSGTGSLDLNGYSATVGTLGGSSGFGTITGSTGSGLTVTQGSDQTFSGTLTGSLAFTKAGANTLTLTNANIYTGATTINAGTLVAGANALSGSAGAFGNTTSAVLLGDTSGSADAALMIGVRTRLGGTSRFNRAVAVRRRLAAPRPMPAHLAG